jgi:hypothetical protein
MELSAMNSKHPANKFMGMAIFLILAMALILSRPALAAQDTWPKRFEHPKGTVVMYQPQLEDFKDDILTARYSWEALRLEPPERSS